MHRLGVPRMADARRRQPDICKYASPSVYKDELYTRLRSSGILDEAKVRASLLMSRPKPLLCMDSHCAQLQRAILRTRMCKRHFSQMYRTCLQCALRKRILDHFRRDLGAPPEKARPASIQQYMVNTLIAEYLGARAHTCTLSVFLPEVCLSDTAVLTHEDILSLLEIRPGAKLHSVVHSSMVEDKENRAFPSTDS